MRTLPFLLFFALGCGRPLAEGVVLLGPEGPVALAVGERLRTERRSNDLLEFVAVVEDSRCPIGADCIQAGRAVVSLLVLQDGQLRERRLTVGDGRHLVTDHGRLTVGALEPHPEIGVYENEPRPYRLQVRLTERD